MAFAELVFLVDINEAYIYRGRFADVIWWPCCQFLSCDATVYRVKPSVRVLDLVYIWISFWI